MLEVVLTIPFWLELAASLTGGLSGAMSAVRARYDLFGVACIAIVTGLAGGIIRDILLQQYGIYAFQKPSLILACVIAGVVVFYFGKLTTYLDPIVDLLDNLSVALWAIVSVGKSMSAGLDIIPATILGTITAVGGGICRDICMNREPEAFQAGPLYGSAALLGSLVFALMRQNHILSDYAAPTCVVLVLGIRYASLFFGFKTRPPHDYSNVITKPVKSVAKRMKPPKGKVQRDKERHHYEKLARFWKRLHGQQVTAQTETSPSQTGSLSRTGNIAHTGKIARVGQITSTGNADTTSQNKANTTSLEASEVQTSQAVADPSDRIVVSREELHQIFGKTQEQKPEKDPFEPSDNPYDF
ncbi:trimeric intracellular cation channel family protein [Eggerthellaceae bacterium 3-80]|nr:trimeric intracellular cation channel family protein [bacterium D16-34]